MDINMLTRIKLVNDKLREELIEEASKYKSDFDKFSFICSKFLKEYEFDYSVLLSPNEIEGSRVVKTKTFDCDGRKVFGSTLKLVDNGTKYEIAVCPSLHALKMGTCAYFSREIEVLCREFNIPYKHVNEVEVCYDGYDKVKKEDELREMLHHYSIVQLDGEEYKIDIAGALMAMDFKKKYPKIDISPRDFVLVDKNIENPFNKIYKEKVELGEE